MLWSRPSVRFEIVVHSLVHWQIVTLLESEIAHLRAQLLAGPDEKDRLLVEYRRRCLVLGCQVNKAVEAKNLADSAIKVLSNFVRVSGLLSPDRCNL